MKIILQDSAEWAPARLGCATASRVSDALAKTKSGWGTGRANYAAELIAERLTGVAAQGYMNAAMQWGVDTEPHAKAAYEFRNDCEVSPGGFVLHPVIGHSGASPDGFVGDQGLIEIKCPMTATHLDSLLGDPVPSKYIMQMQFQMACTDRQWCDFCSFDPRLPESMRLHVVRFKRDDKMIAQLETDITAFLRTEVDEKIAALKQKYENTVLAA